MLILGLLGMYFDAAVVFFTMASLFFRMAMTVLWAGTEIPDLICTYHHYNIYVTNDFHLTWIMESKLLE